MRSQQSIRATLLSLLESFETPDEKKAWKNELFSLYPCDCGWPEAEIDFIFFWKVYAQQRLAAKAYPVFSCLRRECGSMAEGIRALATLPDSLVQKGLKHSYESGELEHISKHVASAVRFGRGGWRELGFVIGGAKRLSRSNFPRSEARPRAEHRRTWACWLLKFGSTETTSMVSCTRPTRLRFAVAFTHIESGSK